MILTWSFTMSDGPHRSLPMRRHWRDVAERADKAAFSPAQVSESLPHALKRDLSEAPLEAVRDMLGGGLQSSLFAEQRVEHLEAARGVCRGSAAGNALIDCAIEAVNDGLVGDAAYHSALRNMLEDTARSALRGIEEHYQRETASDRRTYHIRGRLDAARRQCDFGGLAAELMSGGNPGREAARLPRQTGLDEGPRL